MVMLSRSSALPRWKPTSWCASAQATALRLAPSTARRAGLVLAPRCRCAGSGITTAMKRARGALLCMRNPLFQSESHECHKVLLPGSTILERHVARLLWRSLDSGSDSDITASVRISRTRAVRLMPRLLARRVNAACRANGNEASKRSGVAVAHGNRSRGFGWCRRFRE